MVSVLASSAVDRGLEPRSGQTKGLGFRFRVRVRVRVRAMGMVRKCRHIFS